MIKTKSAEVVCGVDELTEILEIVEKNQENQEENIKTIENNVEKTIEKEGTMSKIGEKFVEEIENKHRERMEEQKKMFEEKIRELKRKKKKILLVTKEKVAEVENLGVEMAKKDETIKSVEEDVKGLQELLKIILPQLVVKNMRVFVPGKLFEVVDKHLEQFKLLFNLEEEVEEGDKSGSFDDGDLLPPPDDEDLPPEMDDFDSPAGKKEKDSIKEKDLNKVLFEKKIATEKVNLLKMSKNQVRDSIFGKENILELGQGYISETISNEMMKHFNKNNSSPQGKQRAFSCSSPSSPSSPAKAVTYLFDCFEKSCEF